MSFRQTVKANGKVVTSAQREEIGACNVMGSIPTHASKKRKMQKYKYAFT